MNYLLIPFIIIGIFSIFIFAFRARNLRPDSFEITPANKDRDKGLMEYEKEIISFLKSLRYKKIEKGNDYMVFRPRPLQRIMGGDVKITINPYWIKVEGPKYMVKIISQIIEIT